MTMTVKKTEKRQQKFFTNQIGSLKPQSRLVPIFIVMFMIMLMFIITVVPKIFVLTIIILTTRTASPPKI